MPGMESLMQGIKHEGHRRRWTKLSCGCLVKVYLHTVICGNLMRNVI